MTDYGLRPSEGWSRGEPPGRVRGFGTGPPGGFHLNYLHCGTGASRGRRRVGRREGGKVQRKTFRGVLQCPGPRNRVRDELLRRLLLRTYHFRRQRRHREQPQCHWCRGYVLRYRTVPFLLWLQRRSGRPAPSIDELVPPPVFLSLSPFDPDPPLDPRVVTTVPFRERRF